jgi:hypothetical protein
VLRFTILAVRVGGRSSSPLAELHVAQHHTRQPEAATRPRQSRRRSPGPPPTTTTTTARAGPSPLPRTLARSRLSAAPWEAVREAHPWQGCCGRAPTAPDLETALDPHVDPVSGILQFCSCSQQNQMSHSHTVQGAKCCQRHARCGSIHHSFPRRAVPPCSVGHAPGPSSTGKAGVGNGGTRRHGRRSRR